MNPTGNLIMTHMPQAHRPIDQKTVEKRGQARIEVDDHFVASYSRFAGTKFEPVPVFRSAQFPNITE